MKIKKELKNQLAIETAKRIKRMEEEFAKEPELKVFENTEKYDQIIAQVGIPVTALCEHHGVAFNGEVSIGYIPDKWLIGLSKLGRISEYYLNPTVRTIQERATHQILQHLKKTLNPKGLIVVIKASHTCIGYRGVKKPSLTITSAIDGLFSSNQSAKQEFLSLIENN